WHIEPWVILAVAALIAVLFYLIFSALVFRVGFPLDDAWIHLTYARNLAEHGEWAFRLGERSAGSTSPLWTVLLSVGFFINLAPYIWTYLLGWVVLTLLAGCAEKTARRLVASYTARVPWAGLFFIFAWHLTWSAVSGMETLLHGLIIFVVLSALLTGSRRYLTLGLLVGLSVWVRPDGLTLLGPILFVALLSEKTWHLRGEALWRTLLGFGALFFPYLLFNLALSNQPLPNTFYAKQAEYGYWSKLPFADRLVDYLLPVLASPFLVLIPAALVWLIKNIRARNWGAVSSLIWFLGYIGIYFMRLPAYQHGRYIIPAFPIMYLWGILGLLELISSPRLNRRIVTLWQVTAVVLTLAFEFVGAQQNAFDVYWIESEMVATANWVHKNIPSGARLAVHDIGALGYYVENPFVDMAGLISPEVVPFIREEDRLAEYLDSNSVEYLITFPGFYPQLTASRESLFEAGSDSSPLQFDENMQVFRWR
ncbi:MAG TPA: hypothetical protein VKP08_20480, partial [Anaerolineales bacterium]|nr:hypothetical protein [Anaerolineales bacterium]